MSPRRSRPASIDFVQGDGDGRGRRVAQPVDVPDDLFEGDLELVGDHLGDPVVGLVGDEEADVVDRSGRSRPGRPSTASGIRSEAFLKTFLPSIWGKNSFRSNISFEKIGFLAELGILHPELRGESAVGDRGGWRGSRARRPLRSARG